MILSIIGPTGVGKTNLAYKLSHYFPIEVISVDAVQIYKHLDIGSAKPSANILAHLPHHLINIVEPNQTYSVKQFIASVDHYIQSIIQRGSIPCLVGGTMMYYFSLTRGLNDIPSTPSSVREKISSWVNQYGIEFAYQQLQKVDPFYAQKIAPTDIQRIKRALEVYDISGKPFSYYHDLKDTSLPTFYPTLSFGMMPLEEDTTLFHHILQSRIEEMFQQGFIEEVIQLKKKYQLTTDTYSMRSVGYKEVFSFIDKDQKDSLACLKEKIFIATRQLVKRQKTWMRRFEELIFIKNIEDLLKYLN